MDGTKKGEKKSFIRDKSYPSGRGVQKCVDHHKRQCCHSTVTVAEEVMPGGNSILRSSVLRNRIYAGFGASTVFIFIYMNFKLETR